MSIDWDRIYRGNPTAADIKTAVKKAQNLPDAGDHGHVETPFPIYNKQLPAIPQGSWDNASLKMVKLKKLKATNQQLNRTNLLWHLANPGKSKFRGKFNSHIQVIQTKNGYAIVDGHHRAAALRMLGVKKDAMWVIRKADL